MSIYSIILPLSLKLVNRGISLCDCRVGGAVDALAKLEPLPLLEIEPSNSNLLGKSFFRPVIGHRPLSVMALGSDPSARPSQPDDVSVLGLDVESHPVPAVGTIVGSVSPLVHLAVVDQLGEVVVVPG